MAIIGSGPAGLVAAHDLRRMGYAVTVFEAKDKMGGLLTDGFPSYRLPRKVVEKDLSIIEKMGIEVHLNTRVGKVSTEALLHGFDAVFLATGHCRSRTDPQGL